MAFRGSSGEAMDGGDHKNGTHEPLAGALFYILFGPIVWAIHLTLVYLGHTLLCALGVSFGALAPGVVSFSVIIVTAVALIVLTVAVVAANSRARAFGNRGSGAMFFRDRIMMALALLSGFGVAWEGASALIIEPCLMLR